MDSNPIIRFLASKLFILSKKALKPSKSFLNLKLEKTTSFVEESIQEATWFSFAISIPNKNIKSHP